MEKWRDRLFAGQVPVEDLVLAQTVTKPLEAYKADVVHTRVAAKMAEEGREVYVGAKIPYVLVGTRDGKLDAVCADDFDGRYDPAVYWRRAWPASRRILESVFPGRNWRLFDEHDHRQAGLFGRKR
jgi:DNA polymerase elongation subunit (family B)